MPDSLPCRCTPLLAVNYAPLQSEATHVRNMISKHEQEFEEIDVEIAILLSRRQGLMKHIQGLKCILSHIHRLPEEILTSIFILTLPKAESWFPHSDTDSYYMPVCKRWRAVSLSCQALWLRPVIPANSRLSVATFSRQLSCSGNSPLDVRLWCKTDTPQMAGLLEAIVRCSQRWSALDITCRSDWTEFRNQLDHLKGNVGQLREVQIVGIWSSEAAQWGGDQFESFAVAPRLQTLTVAHVRDPAQSLLLPWHQLTKYRSTGRADDHLRVLRLCPNLISAQLSTTDHLEIDDTQPLVVLPRLRKLYVVPDLLHRLSLPVLEEIVLDRQHHDPIFPLLSLCLRDNPPLSCVFLLPGALVAATAISLLEQTSTITTLRIHVAGRDPAPQGLDALLERLSVAHEHRPCIAPDLVKLTFSGKSEVFGDRFLDMVESRWKHESGNLDCACRPLEQIEFLDPGWRRLRSDIAQRLRALEEEGMHVRIGRLSFDWNAMETQDWRYPCRSIS
ncbi:hypothetical protein B0H10DRAFT_2042521 [Mycena sp. CBHHK59/15]|nr:hypothetical protein B0H10DRAFT_2042521 [Mycena sp. CBHHK59/15]